MAEIVDARSVSDPAALTDRLELGDLILFPGHAFSVAQEERHLISPSIFSGESKNASYDSTSGRLGGVALEDKEISRLSAMMGRYADFAQDLVATCAPTYAAKVDRRRTSFRPGEVSTRVLSPRKDDRRLHVDAFPANPVQGRRILRVFTNVHPEGRDRIWRIGGQRFAAFAEAFLPRLKQAPNPFILSGMEALKITRGRRTPYDHAMLQLHDLAKLDDDFQAKTLQATIFLPAGSSWMVYTDSVLHAAMAGQHLFEQTFLLRPDDMLSPELSPVRTLERLLGARLT
jgi:3-deoxy-D-manno-oct-2-ulosonic acid (Kdo) hydroxylase